VEAVALFAELADRGSKMSAVYLGNAYLKGTSG
jgi:hypothetical protein